MVLSKIPIILEGMNEKERNKQILRFAVIAELDAINLYEQMAEMTGDSDLKAVLLDVAKEEKEHVGEFQTLLLQHDEEQAKELKDGEKEVRELLGS